MITFPRLLLLACCFAASPLFAQNMALLESIPQKPIGVITFHGSTLQSNIDVNHLNESEFIVKLQHELSRELGNESAVDSNFVQLLGELDKNGVNTQSNSYLYFTMDSVFVTINYLMELSNEQQFAAFAKNYISADKQITIPLLKGASGYKIAETNSTLTWNKQQAKVTTYIENGFNKDKDYDFYDNYDYNYTIDYDSLAAAEELKQVEEEKELESQILSRVANSYQALPNQSILEAPGFMKSLKEGSDISFWAQNTALWQLDNLSLLSLFPEVGPYAEPIIAKVKSLYEDAYITGDVNFTDTGITLDMASYTSKEVAKYSKLISKSKFEKSLLRYIPNDYVACYAATFNPSAITPVTKEFLYPIIQEVPNFGTRATDILDIIDVFVDEEAIYDLFEGDVVMLFNGMSKVQADSTYYEYDEDYNYEVKTKTYEKTIPILTFLLSTNDEATWKKIIDLPSIVPFYVNMTSFYEFEKEGIKVYFAVQNGVVIVTTDQQLVIDYLEKGLPKDIRVSGDKLKEITATNNFMKVNATTLDVDNKDVMEIQQALEKMQFESVMYAGGHMKGNASLGHAEINFGNKQQNSINFLVDLIDELIAIDAHESTLEIEEESIEEEVDEND